MLPRCDASVTGFHMLRTDLLDYDLPSDLIATEPAARRDAARMMVLDRRGKIVAHETVASLPDYLQPGDAMVMNNSRVIPARYVARRLDTGGHVEGLFLHSAGGADVAATLLRPGHRVRPGQQYAVEATGGDVQGAVLTILDRVDDHWLVRLDGPLSWRKMLDRAGHAPLPPYILRQRRLGGDTALDRPEDREQYQTVYAGPDGAVAAPTAGLHLTAELIAACRSRGIETGFVTLHVGAGTFKPVECEFVEQHPIHEEWFSVPQDTIELLQRGRPGSGRLVAVGTTTVRALESVGSSLPAAGESVATRLLITPGYQFGRVDGLLTNFHLPRSSLMALVAAMIGVEPLLRAYREAIDRGYRFYSYGDCMLILPARPEA